MIRHSRKVSFLVLLAATLCVAVALMISP